MDKTIIEGKAVLQIPYSEKLSKKMPVFYNPVMKHNRDVSILLLKSVPDKKIRVALPLAGSGVRGIRFLKELGAQKIDKVCLNDISLSAVHCIKRNLGLNKIISSRQLSSKAEVSNKDANIFLRESKGFDYVDVDPFGTPNPFLDAAVQSLARNGIMAVTATDTACLCGTSPKACVRKYWAVPLHNEIMQEIGLRILIRKVQLIGSQYSKALVPIYCYSKDHYMRAFFRNQKGKSKADEMLKQHGLFESAGPMWLGKLWDTALAGAIAKQAYSADHELRRMLDAIAKESRIDKIGFYDLHELSKKFRKTVPTNEKVLEEIKKRGFKASPTHFCGHGIRSEIPEKELEKIIRNQKN